jgi:hypothetical protein
LPDSQAGCFRSFRLRTLLAANHQQGNSPDQHQTAHYRRNRNSLVIVPGGMDRPKIEYLFSMGVGEPLVRKRQPAEDNQQNPNPNDRFHISLSLLNRSSSPLNQVDYEYGQSNEQEDVNESSERVGSDHSEEPKNAQHYKNRPKHGCSNLTRNPHLEVFTALVSQLDFAFVLPDDSY